MASKSPSSTTTTTQVKLPPWVDAASRSNYGLAQQIADKPLQQYSGTGVADISPDTQRALDLMGGSVGTGGAALAKAGALTDKAGGGILGLNRADYSNPFSSEVEAAGLGALNDSRIQSLMQNADKSRAAGAFGGSRSGIVDAVTNAQTAKAAGVLSAGIHSDAFDKSTGAMQGDLAAFLNAGGQQRQQASGEIAARNSDVAGLLNSGGIQTNQAQKLIDSDKAKFDQSNNYDLERLNVLLSSLGMSPYGKTETSKSTATAGSSGTDFGALGTGFLSLLGGIFSSDRNDKTDIKKLGKDPDTGIDLYAYRYKGDPKSYPKVVGPMAQDIEKMFPGAVRKVGGKRVVIAHV